MLDLQHKKSFKVIETNNELLHDNLTALKWLVDNQHEIKPEYLKLGFSLQVHAISAPSEVDTAITQHIKNTLDRTVSESIRTLKTGINTWMLNIERELAELRTRLEKEFPEEF